MSDLRLGECPDCGVFADLSVPCPHPVIGPNESNHGGIQPDPMVHTPPHYTTGGIETIDFIEAKLGPEGFAHYLQGTVLKYITRYQRKANPRQDLEKARWYLDRLIERTDPTP